MMTRFFITAFVLSLTYSCSSNVELAIDNPTDVPVLVKIDTLSVEIPNNEVVWVEMGKGSHTVTLENDSVVEFDFQDNLYMLNPTLSPYLMTTEKYGNQNDRVNDLMANFQTNDTIDYLGIELIGDYGIVDDLVNPITWDYGPREETPEMIEVESTASQAIVKKLMSPQEFKDDMVESVSNEMGDDVPEGGLTFEHVKVLFQLSSQMPKNEE